MKHYARAAAWILPFGVGLMTPDALWAQAASSQPPSSPQWSVQATPLLVGLLTTAAALLGAWVNNRSALGRLELQLGREQDRHRAEARRDRIEELYASADRWTRDLASYALPYLSVMAGNLTYDQALDMTIEHGKQAYDSSDRIARLEMIMRVYFPSLLPSYQLVIDARGEINQILASHKLAYKRGETDGREFVPALRSALERLETASEAWKERVAEAARAV